MLDKAGWDGDFDDFDAGSGPDGTPRLFNWEGTI